MTFSTVEAEGAHDSNSWPRCCSAQTKNLVTSIHLDSVGAS